jgi:hypothetical protein
MAKTEIRPEHGSVHEYRNVPSMARVERYAECAGRFGTLYLTYCPAGYYQAGSMARYSARPTWLAGFDAKDGTTHGQHFLDKASAEDRFMAQVDRLLDDDRRKLADGVTWLVCPTCGETLDQPHMGDQDTIPCPCRYADAIGYAGEQ